MTCSGVRRWALAWTLACAAGLALAQAPRPKDLQPRPEEAYAAHLTAEVLSRYHYNATPFNEALSSRIFDQYLKALDSEKVFFLASDVEGFSVHRRRLGDVLLNEDLRVPFAMFNLYQRRVVERFAYAQELLAKGFDFTVQESYQFARGKEAQWPASEAEMRDLWRRRVKNDWLRLKLANDKDELIRSVLQKRYEGVLKRIARSRSEDAFETFMNAYTTAIEPHTNYMGPRASQEFDISMRLSLVGIGAVLTELDGYTTIRELVPGGPASLSGQLKAGDRIVGVSQARGGPMTDVLGLSQEDVVAMIRGTADTPVVLDVLPAEAGPDGEHKIVSLIRKPIKLEEQAAKSSIKSVKDGNVTRKLGVITLPSFYEDFSARQKGDPEYRSAARDVARLLAQMKKEGVQGVLVDLRNNGGGSLEQAIQLTGLFIDRGPVVQQRSASGEITVGADTVPGMAWEGPLGVLINRASASASEIFAAAIQDYGRGIVLGEPSFGKGTVQSVVNLDQIAKSSKAKLGELRMTVAQFFRVDGGTTQLRGVTPDIPFPALSDLETMGESSYENALPWVQIKRASFVRAGDLTALVPGLLARHQARLASDPGFRYLAEDLAELKAQRNRKTISLNEAERRREREAQLARAKSRQARAPDAATAQAALEDPAVPGDDGLMPGERNLRNQLAAEKARKEAKDIWLDEALNVVNDKVSALSRDTTAGARNKGRVASLR